MAANLYNILSSSISFRCFHLFLLFVPINRQDCSHFKAPDNEAWFSM